MITTKQTLEILPHAIDLMEKTGVETFLKNLIDSGTEPKAVDGYMVLKHVLKSASMVQHEIAAIVSVLKSIAHQEALELPLIESIKCIKSVYEDEELRSFFTSLL